MQMALMFLVNAEIYTEPIWAAFIASAAELTLRRHVPPTRPAPPQLFPDIPEHVKQHNSKCWTHGEPIYRIYEAAKQRSVGPGAHLLASLPADEKHSCVRERARIACTMAVRAPSDC
jgi:hypothetical protein